MKGDNFQVSFFNSKEKEEEENAFLIFGPLFPLQKGNESENEGRLDFFFPFRKRKIEGIEGEKEARIEN